MENLEQQLKEAKEILEKKEYELRWGGHRNPYEYVRSARFAEVSYWRRKVEELNAKIPKLSQ
jgi:hypothetical protein